MFWQKPTIGPTAIHIYMAPRVGEGADLEESLSRKDSMQSELIKLEVHVIVNLERKRIRRIE